VDGVEGEADHRERQKVTAKRPILVDLVDDAEGEEQK
jgi:hypothetical protein